MHVNSSNATAFYTTVNAISLPFLFFTRNRIYLYCLFCFYVKIVECCMALSVLAPVKSILIQIFSMKLFLVSDLGTIFSLDIKF